MKLQFKLFLTLIMVFTLLLIAPILTLAAGSGIYFLDKELAYDTYYLVNGRTGELAPADSGNYYLYLQNQGGKNTLTINNLAIDTTIAGNYAPYITNAVLSAEQDLTINLLGESSLKTYAEYAILGRNIEIIGDSLQVEASTAAIHSDSALGVLTVDVESLQAIASQDISTSETGAGGSGGDGIDVSEFILLGGDVVAKGATSLVAYDTIATTVVYDNVIERGEDDTITDFNSITSYTNENFINLIGGDGINANVTVKGGTLTATGGDTSLYAKSGLGGSGIFGNLLLEGGQVTAMGGGGDTDDESLADGENGVGVLGNVMVNGGLLNAQSVNFANEGEKSAAAIEGDIILNGGAIHAQSAKGNTPWAIDPVILGQVTVNGGSLTAIGQTGLPAFNDEDKPLINTPSNAILSITAGHYPTIYPFSENLDYHTYNYVNISINQPGKITLLGQELAAGYHKVAADGSLSAGNAHDYHIYRTWENNSDTLYLQNLNLSGNFNQPLLVAEKNLDLNLQGNNILHDLSNSQIVISGQGAVTLKSTGNLNLQGAVGIDAAQGIYFSGEFGSNIKVLAGSVAYAQKPQLSAAANILAGANAPGSAMAATTNWQQQKYVDLTIVNTVSVTVAGTNLAYGAYYLVNTPAEGNSILSPGTADNYNLHLAADGSVLTLNNAQITSKSATPVMISGDLIIQLNGENVIGGDTPQGEGGLLHASNNLILRGENRLEDSLNIEDNIRTRGISCQNKLDIQNATIKANSGASFGYSVAAIYAANGITISNSDVQAYAEGGLHFGTTHANHALLVSGGIIDIIDSEVTAVGGLDADNDESTLNTKGGNAIGGYTFPEGWAVPFSINVKNSTLNLLGGANLFGGKTNAIAHHANLFLDEGSKINVISGGSWYNTRIFDGGTYRYPLGSKLYINGGAVSSLNSFTGNLYSIEVQAGTTDARTIHRSSDFISYRDADSAFGIYGDRLYIGSYKGQPVSWIKVQANGDMLAENVADIASNDLNDVEKTLLNSNIFTYSLTTNNVGIIEGDDLHLKAGKHPNFRLNTTHILHYTEIDDDTLVTAATQFGELYTVEPRQGGQIDGTSWKVTIFDEEREDFSASYLTLNGGLLSYNYSNAKTGVGEYISMIIIDPATDNILYYAKIKDLSTASANANSQTFTLPAELAGAEQLEIYLFNEKESGTFAPNFASNYQGGLLLNQNGLQLQNLYFNQRDISTDLRQVSLDNPVQGANTAVTYHSSDETVATVNDQGQVRLIGAGEATIYADAARNEEYAEARAEYQITVEKTPLTITVHDYYAETGNAVPTLANLTYTVEGLIPGDSLIELPVISYDSPPDMSQVGQYTIKIGGAETTNNDNYSTITYNTATLWVVTDMSIAQYQSQTFAEGDYIEIGGQGLKANSPYNFNVGTMIFDAKATASINEQAMRSQITLILRQIGLDDNGQALHEMVVFSEKGLIEDFANGRVTITYR